MRELVIFDLDGTIALNDHRQHLVQKPKGQKEWNKFFDLCEFDIPNRPVIYTLSALEKAGFYCHIWSGRTDRVRGITERWLEANGLEFIPLKMRPQDDHQSDVSLKQSWLNASLSEGRKPIMTFDDRNSVVEMWRSNGIPCFQVAPGDF